MAIEKKVNVEDWTIKFGKFKGAPFKDLESWYLKFLIQKGVFKEDEKYPSNTLVREYITSRINNKCNIIEDDDDSDDED